MMTTMATAQPMAMVLPVPMVVETGRPLASEGMTTGISLVAGVSFESGLGALSPADPLASPLGVSGVGVDSGPENDADADASLLDEEESLDDEASDPEKLSLISST